MRQDARIEALYREGQLGGRWFDPRTLEAAERAYRQRVARMVDQLLDEIGRREQLLLLCPVK